MSKDRLADSAKSLEKILSTDYEKLRLEQITEAENSPDNGFKKYRLENAKTPASEKKQHALKKHFSYYAGHCCECYKPLEKHIFPHDVNEKHDRGEEKKIGFSGDVLPRYYWRLVRMVACEEHQKRLKDKEYKVFSCLNCRAVFTSYSEFKVFKKVDPKYSDIGYCSLACRSFYNYQLRKAKKNTIPCQCCKTEFIPKRKDAVFCSGKCRTASHRQKLKATCNG